MPRSLRWFPEAVLDLTRLREFINVHNPDAAARAAKLIREAAQKLQNNAFCRLLRARYRTAPERFVCPLRTSRILAALHGNGRSNRYRQNMAREGKQTSLE